MGKSTASSFGKFAWKLKWMVCKKKISWEHHYHDDNDYHDYHDNHNDHNDHDDNNDFVGNGDDFDDVGMSVGQLVFKKDDKC